jgi:hypothetical protein
MHPGDYISFEKDGAIHTERVESVHYSSGSPAIYKRLNRWQQMVRRFTPRRWRKSLLVRAAEPPSIRINDPNQSPIGKTLAQLEQMKASIDRLLQ